MPRVQLPAVTPKRRPWNKGRIIGQKRPLLPKQAWATLDVIARVELPDEDIYATHTNLKMKKIAPGFAKITSHLSNAGTLAVQPVDGEVPEHLDLPRLLRDLGYRTAGAPAILLVGNPLYHDATMPGASTRDAWPSDAHYALTPAESPFGTADMEDRLVGLKINWCITQDDFVNGPHEAGVHRANAMMIAGYGAQLVTYTPNLTQCFERTAAGDVSGADSFPPLDPGARLTGEGRRSPSPPIPVRWN
jgi:hypothetical protein